MQPTYNSKQSTTRKLVVAIQVQREAVCDEVGCWQTAVAFDSKRLMFVCADHNHKQVEVQQ